MEVTDGETWRQWEIADKTKDVERHYIKSRLDRAAVAEMYLNAVRMRDRVNDLAAKAYVFRGIEEDRTQDTPIDSRRCWSRRWNLAHAMKQRS